jgi:carbonic anhydrase/acetyltransferase-like protein (isoleucine patch superfamily)
MSIVKPYNGILPRLGKGVYLAEGSAVIGDVELGPECSVWYGSIIRGDVNHIRLGARVNVQDGSVIHVVRRTHPTIIGDDVTLGHRVVAHGCTIERGALIGIGAIVLDGVVVGTEAVVGAGSVVTPGTEIPARCLAVGTPARVRRELRPEELAYNRETAANYCRLAREHAEARAT